MRSALMPPVLAISGGRNRFSLTVRLAKIARSSGQSATPSLAIRSIGNPTSSRSRNMTEPERLPTMPMIDFKVVVLPAPLRPSRVTTSPSRTSRSTPWRMCDSLYQACRPLTSSTVLARVAGASASAASGMSSPHIGFPDLRVLRHRAVVAFRQHPSAGQDRDAMRQIGDHLQIVLDHQDGAVRGCAADEIGGAIDVLVAHARHRLIEQHHF